jgi:hypothetical protein
MHGWNAYTLGFSFVFVFETGTWEMGFREKIGWEMEFKNKEYSNT